MTVDAIQMKSKAKRKSGFFGGFGKKAAESEVDPEEDYEDQEEVMMMIEMMMIMMIIMIKLLMIVIMIVCYFTRCSFLSSPATTIDSYPADDQQEAGGVSSRVGTTVLLSQVMMFHFDCHILCDHHAYLRQLLPQWS